MEVIGHQAEGEQPHLVAYDRLGENPLEGLIIAVGVKDRQPCVRPVESVIDQPSLRGPWLSSHEPESSDSAPSRQERFPTPFRRDSVFAGASGYFGTGCSHVVAIY